jgi:hypothetical protein
MVIIVNYSHNKTIQKWQMLCRSDKHHHHGKTGFIYVTEEHAKKDEKLFLHYLEKRKPPEIQILAPPGRLNWHVIPGKSVLFPAALRRQTKRIKEGESYLNLQPRQQS